MSRLARAVAAIAALPVPGSSASAVGLAVLANRVDSVLGEGIHSFTTQQSVFFQSGNGMINLRPSTNIFLSAHCTFVVNLHLFEEFPICQVLNSVIVLVLGLQGQSCTGGQRLFWYSFRGQLVQTCSFLSGNQVYQVLGLSDISQQRIMKSWLVPDGWRCLLFGAQVVSHRVKRGLGEVIVLINIIFLYRLFSCLGSLRVDLWHLFSWGTPMVGVLHL